MLKKVVYLKTKGELVNVHIAKQNSKPLITDYDGYKRYTLGEAIELILEDPKYDGVNIETGEDRANLAYDLAGYRNGRHHRDYVSPDLINIKYNLELECQTRFLFRDIIDDLLRYGFNFKSPYRIAHENDPRPPVKNKKAKKK